MSKSQRKHYLKEKEKQKMTHNKEIKDPRRQTFLFSLHNLKNSKLIILYKMSTDTIVPGVGKPQNVDLNNVRSRFTTVTMLTTQL